MLTTTALKYFKTKTAIAAALDVSKTYVSKFERVVPFPSAVALELVTNRKLRVDPDLYPKDQIHGPLGVVYRHIAA